MINMDANEKEFDKLPIVGDLKIAGGVRGTRKKAEEAWLREVKNYEFHNVEQPGNSLTFTYGDTKNSMRFVLHHGAKVRLPRHVAMHCESIGRPIYEMDGYQGDKRGEMMVVQNNKRLIGRAPRFMLREQFEAPKL